jgi:hypothetical protein
VEAVGAVRRPHASRCSCPSCSGQAGEAAEQQGVSRGGGAEEGGKEGCEEATHCEDGVDDFLEGVDDDGAAGPADARMIVYFEQFILHDYVSTYENYQMIWINPMFTILVAGRKTFTQSTHSKRIPHNSIFASKTRVEALNTPIWG